MCISTSLVAMTLCEIYRALEAPTWLPLHKKESFNTLFFIVYFLWVIQSNKIKMKRGSSPLSILNEQKSVFLTDILIKIFLNSNIQFLIISLQKLKQKLF